MTIYVFGYGSLMNMKENSRELENPLNRKVWPVLVTGLKRTLNVGVADNTYKVFGVKDMANKSITCNGILFAVSDDELDNIINRERNYTAKVLKKSRILFNYNKNNNNIKFKPNDDIICFYPKAKYSLTQKQALALPVRKNYLPICLAGAKAISDEFLSDFLT